MDLQTLFYRTVFFSLLFLFVIVSFLFLVEYTLREGLQDDPLALAIQSIKSAQQDSRMTPTQQQALQDALYYAEDIKNL